MDIIFWEYIYTGSCIRRCWIIWSNTNHTTYYGVQGSIPFGSSEDPLRYLEFYDRRLLQLLTQLSGNKLGWLANVHIKDRALIVDLRYDMNDLGNRQHCKTSS